MTKNILLATSAAIALAATAQAGEVMSPKSPIMPPPAPECRLQWFLGASGGYLLDAEEDMYHLQFGAKKQCDQHSHALFLELGYVDGDDDFIEDNFDSTQGDRLTLDTEIIPLTLNYKYSQNINEKLEWYLGAGAGVAFVNNDAGNAFDDSDTVFYAQAFAGLTYSFNSSVEAFGGVRYIYMDEPEASSIDDDFLVELGLRYNF